MRAISATDEWRSAHPGAVIGLLELSGIVNHGASLALAQRKREVEARARERYRDFTRADFLALPVLSDYERYYKRFNKTYHVQLQLESIVLKGKALPDVTPLVDANFMAEIETFVLAAGHDVAWLEGDVSIDVSQPDDVMTQMNGSAKVIRAGDMLMKDAGGICCSILYGQDNRSPISAQTTHVLYVAYAPAGVPAERVDAHLRRIEENVRLAAPDAVLQQHALIAA